MSPIIFLFLVVSFISSDIIIFSPASSTYVTDVICLYPFNTSLPSLKFNLTKGTISPNDTGKFILVDIYYSNYPYTSILQAADNYPEVLVVFDITDDYPGSCQTAYGGEIITDDNKRVPVLSIGHKNYSDLFKDIDLYGYLQVEFRGCDGNYYRDYYESALFYILFVTALCFQVTTFSLLITRGYFYFRYRNDKICSIVFTFLIVDTIGTIIKFIHTAILQNGKLDFYYNRPFIYWAFCSEFPEPLYDITSFLVILFWIEFLSNSSSKSIKQSGAFLNKFRTFFIVIVVIIIILSIGIFLIIIFVNHC